MTPNNNLNPLPWYYSVKEQNHNKSYAFGNIYPLYSPNNMLLPFQIYRKKDNSLIKEIIIYTYKGNKYIDITRDLIDTGLVIRDYGSYELIIYPAYIPMNINIKQGRYYVRITTTNNINYYSEIFTVVPNISNFLMIEYWDNNNLQLSDYQIDYTGNYRNRIYIKEEIGKPEYKFNEVGEDRDGYFFPEKQLSEKTYRFMMLAPEFLCDAMRIIRLSDNVIINDRGRIYNIDTFLITVKWQTQGDIASVECEFETDTVIKKIGWTSSGNGDFNNDFNNDFNRDN